VHYPNKCADHATKAARNAGQAGHFTQVAHQIVRQMGGSLLAQANTDRGMTFSVVLPAKVKN